MRGGMRRGRGAETRHKQVLIRNIRHGLSQRAVHRVCARRARRLAAGGPRPLSAWLACVRGVGEAVCVRVCEVATTARGDLCDNGKANANLGGNKSRNKVWHCLKKTFFLILERKSSF